MVKKKGSRFEFQRERDAALIRACRRIIRTFPTKINGMRHLAHLVAGENAPRFYVTPERASRVVYMMQRGKKPSKMIDERAKMYDEIFLRTMMYKRQHPSLKLAHCIERVVEQPAPSFYMTEKSILINLYRITRGMNCKL